MSDEPLNLPIGNGLDFGANGNLLLNHTDNTDGSTLSWPPSVGPPGSFLATDGLGGLFYTTPTGAGLGNVSTALNFTNDNRLTRTDTAVGPKHIQSTGVVLDDTDSMSSLNGLSMIGTHELLASAPIKFQDATNVNSISISAPPSVTTTYAMTLPPAPPAAQDILKAITPTQMAWVSDGGNVPSTTSRVVYVATYGNDLTGIGSMGTPYKTLAKAVNVANSLSTATSPVNIIIMAGSYVENNTAGAIAVTAAGVTILSASGATIIKPNTLSQPLLSATVGINMANLIFQAVGVSTNTGIVFSGTGTQSTISNVKTINFQTGMSFGGTNNRYTLNNCEQLVNGTAISISGTTVILNNHLLRGSLTMTPANNGVTVTGAQSLLFVNNGVYENCVNQLQVSNSAQAYLSGMDCRNNTFDVVATTAAVIVADGCVFSYSSSNADINVQASGAGTDVELTACTMNGKNGLGVAQGSGVKVTNSAKLHLASCAIDDVSIGIQCGTAGDTSSTSVLVTGTTLENNVLDVQQLGQTTLDVIGSVLDSNKLSVADSTNVTFDFSQLIGGGRCVGKYEDIDTELLHVLTNSADMPVLSYKNNFYNTGGLQMSTVGEDVSVAASSAMAASFIASTSDRTKTTAVSLYSDTAPSMGGTTSLRGWDIVKNATTAELAFKFRNSDLAAMSNIAQYTVMQLDGVNKILQLPALGSQIMWGGDTNLYRIQSNTLKTDGNIRVVGLTANRALTADVNKQLTSSNVTDTELGFLSGVTSAVQTQINSKVSKAGDVMTGSLQIPIGTAGAPALNFTGASSTGLFSTAGGINLSTGGVERLKIDSSGLVTIDGFTSTGIVHNSNAGLLSTSLIVNADVDPAAAIADTKLATISTGGKVSNSATTATSANTLSAIVARDASGNFSAGTITASLIGTASGSVAKTGDTMSGALVLPAGSNLLPSLNFTGSTTSGLSAAAGALSLNTNAIERVNISNTGAMTVSDLASFGLVHASAAGLLTSSLLVDADITVGTITDSKLATISSANKVSNSATTAASTNTASAIVARDVSGNFTAGTITANLTGNASGNVLKAGDTMTGALVLPAGTTALPSLNFIGSLTSGLSAAAGALSLSTNGAERLKIDATGAVTIDGLTSTGIVHNSAAGLLSTSLIVDADVDPAAAIVDTKLATISTANKVSNSATTATSSNTASAIVARDASGNFTAGTITAALTGNASGNVLKAGDIMTGSLVLPAGTTAAPSLNFTGSLTTGMTAAAADTLSLSTNAVERINISSGGAVTIPNLSSLGVVHNSAAGLLSTSLIVDADVDPAAAIVDTKLATISTAGKVSNSATTATSANTASAIVARNASGGFSAGTITAALTGAASSNVLKAGDIMTGSLVLPAGTTAAPSLNFIGSTTTGLAASAGALIVSTSGAQRMGVSSAGVVSINGFTTAGVVHNNASGNLTSSTIVNADVDPAAAIVDTKLATISTVGKVSNSATTATSANTASAIVARDASGNFSAGTITAALTGAASSNVLKAGDTMTGSLVLPAGTTAAPSLNFTGSTTTGLSTNSNALSLSTAGTERINIAAGGAVTLSNLNSTGIVHNSSAGLLTTSLIVDADITPGTISDIKLQSGQTNKQAVRVATNAVLSSAVTYANGTAGFGATLTNAGTQATLTVDGVILAVGDRLLVKNSASALQNGIYIVTASGSGTTNWFLTRALDFDVASDIKYGSQTRAVEGTTNAQREFQMTNAGAITVGITGLTWVDTSNISNSSATATAATTTTSTTDVQMTDMTLTPVAGTYLVTFSTIVSVNSSATRNVNVSIYSGGTQIAHSARPVNINASGIGHAVHTQAVTTVDGTQVIEVQWNVSANTATANQRSMILVRLA
jgi:hypothetical protein